MASNGSNISACGVYDCGSCDYAASEQCTGCRLGNSNSEQPCALFACAEAKGLPACSECMEQTCELRPRVESICPMRSRFENKRWWAGRVSRALESRRACTDDGSAERMPERIINRMRWYLTALDVLVSEGAESVSSWQLAARVGVSAALIRKDLSRFGEFGTPSFGYRIDFLRERIRSILSLDCPKTIAWVGACALRHSQAALVRLNGHNCSVVAVFDVDDTEIGKTIGGHVVRHVDAMEDVIGEAGISAAVLAVSGPRAGEIADKLVTSGARAILNMSGEMLALPGHVKVSSLDVAGELLELCYYCRDTSRPLR